MLTLTKKQYKIVCSHINKNYMVLLKTGLINSVLPFVVRINPIQTKYGFNINKTLLN